MKPSTPFFVFSSLIFILVLWYTNPFGTVVITEVVYCDQLFDGKETAHVEQNDPKLLQCISLTNFLNPPSNEPYNLSFKGDPSIGQSDIIKTLFANKTNGFFVECGALDGEWASNTLSLERDLGWKGLLIEADPTNYGKLMKKNRKAWTSNTCLAVHSYPHQVIFHKQNDRGKITNDAVGQKSQISDGQKQARVQCFPFITILNALNVSSVDYFSLDVEGNELDVLKTIPFDAIQIKTLSVEFINTPGGAPALEAFMAEQGYKVHSKLTIIVKEKKGLAHDIIFLHKDFRGV